MKRKKIFISGIIFAACFVILIIYLFLTYPTNRDPSDEFKVKGMLKSIKLAAGEYYKNHQIYTKKETSSCNQADSFFTTEPASRTLSFIDNNQGHKVTCHATQDTWAVGVKLKHRWVTSDTWCIDSKAGPYPGSIQTNGLCNFDISEH